MAPRSNASKPKDDLETGRLGADILVTDADAVRVVIDALMPDLSQRSGAGVEPTEPWATRPHWF
jgi:hypothetical protein